MVSDKASQGPLLKNLLAGSAALHKHMMHRQPLLEPETDVDYFLSFLRPHFVNGSPTIYLYRM
eukprot:458795-Prorocentrum_lima.AAC.1